jgi:dTDP-4-amino-4,6-dideoxygalactose transaminase
MIELTKPNTPDPEVLRGYLNQIAESGWYTNNGPLVQELELRIADSLHSDHFLLTSNGTVSLQLLLRAFARKGSVLTTPYSYVATANAIEWQGLTPKFVDIAPGEFFPDPDRLEAAITSEVSAIMLTHVYGLVGPIEAYQEIARRKGIALLFDAAHAFHVRVNGKPVDAFGDASSYSFHATKTFHTVEGGGIAISDEMRYEELFLYRSFGHRGDVHYSSGINAKNSEVHAAYGLAQWDSLPLLLEKRKANHAFYVEAFQGLDVECVLPPSELEWNYGYFPLIMPNESLREQLRDYLVQRGVMARRYFFPSLNTIPQFVGSARCPEAEAMSARALCIPVHAQLSTTEREMIATLIHECLNA